MLLYLCAVADCIIYDGGRAQLEGNAGTIVINSNPY